MKAGLSLSPRGCTEIKRIQNTHLGTLILCVTSELISPWIDLICEPNGLR